MTEMKWRREIHLPMSLETRVREIAQIEEVLVADLIIDLILRGIEHFDAETAEIVADRAAQKPETVDVMTQADEDAADAWARAELSLRQFVAEVDATGEVDADDGDDDQIVRVGDERDAEFEAMIPQKPLVRLKRGHYENQPIYMRDIKGLNWDDRYLVLAEVESIDHYVVMNLTTGKILRGMFHLDRFERVPLHEI